MSQHEQQHMQQMIRLLTTAAATTSLYSLEHLQVQRLCRQALDHLLMLHGQHQTLTLKIIDEQIIFANHPLPESLAGERFVEVLAAQGISHLELDAGVTVEELLGLVKALCRQPGQKGNPPQNSEHLRYGQVEVRLRTGGASPSAELLALGEIAERETDRFLEIIEAAKRRQQLNMGGLNEIVDSFIAAFSAHGDSFLAIAPLRAMDEYTYTHSTNICLLNLAQARLLGIEGGLLNDIGIAAMLHDVGKMFIPNEILVKAGQLTAEEWQIMQQHPRLGAEYLLCSPGVPRLAVITAYEHHMRFDGAGYPKPTRPWQQNLCSYMTAISDTYDAMRTRRSYEASLAFEQIINAMLEMAGSKLHPQLTYAFLRVLSRRDHDGAGTGL